MKIINTDGLVLFGPGSEWLWFMLQFLALATTFYAIYRQLRLQASHPRQRAPSARRRVVLRGVTPRSPVLPT